MTSEEYFNILSNVKSFPTIPEIYNRLQTALEDPETGIEQVAVIIMQDPVLTAKLIKIANSSFFGFREKVVSIQKAISFLGLNLVKNLTLSTDLLSHFTGTKKNMDRKGFWQHAVGVAVAARLIARDYSASPNQQDELFTIGLLHDIGKTVTEHYFPEQYNRIINLLDARARFFWEAEKEVLGLTHAETGRWVAQFWNFDSKVVNIIAYHHALEAGFQFISEREKLYLSIINLSDVIVKDLKYGTSGDRKESTVNPLAVKFLDLKKSQFEDYTRQLRGQLENIDDFISSQQ